MVRARTCKPTGTSSNTCPHTQADDQLIVAAPLAELKGIDFGAPLHSLVIAGNVHVMEEEMIDCFRPHNQPGLKPYEPPQEQQSDEDEDAVKL